MKPGWHRQLALGSKIELLRDLARFKGRRFMKLHELGIPTSTYYGWQRRYQSEGGDGLASRKRTTGIYLEPAKHPRTGAGIGNCPQQSGVKLPVVSSEDY